jgi:5-methylcytosine-specific restriction endonuclease McrA
MIKQAIVEKLVLSDHKPLLNIIEAPITWETRGPKGQTSMTFVFVVDTNKQPLNPVHPGRARMLLKAGKAAVYQHFPFTLILKQAVEEPQAEPLRIKIDPGSKTTGIAIVNDASGQVVFAAELEHRGAVVKQRLDDRRAIRRSRRNRHTRYRKPRFQNRRRREGWLPPSLESRISNITTWVQRLRRYAPLQAISMELVKFDLQKMENPEISGAQYQQGTLAGYELREYLLEKWQRRCAYCGKEGIPLQVEHIHPRAKNGSNRTSNLTLACEKCNIAKGTQDIRDFLVKKPDLLKKIQAQAKAPLRDAAAVNASRWALFRRLQAQGLPIECGSGGLTKFNRSVRGLPKTHWLDASCVGTSTPEILQIAAVKPLHIKAMGSGNRQMCQTDKFGFPKQHRQRHKRYFGFQTGDMVRAMIPRGKYTGTYTAKVTVRASGTFKLRVKGQDISCNHGYCQSIHRSDGYLYSSMVPLPVSSSPSV